MLVQMTLKIVPALIAGKKNQSKPQQWTEGADSLLCTLKMRAEVYIYKHKMRLASIDQDWCQSNPKRPEHYYQSQYDLQILIREHSSKDLLASRCTGRPHHGTERPPSWFLLDNRWHVDVYRGLFGVKGKWCVEELWQWVSILRCLFVFVFLAIINQSTIYE